MRRPSGMAGRPVLECNQSSEAMPMGIINLGPQGLPIATQPVVPPVPQLVQAAPPQPPTAIPALDRQASSNSQKNELGHSGGGGSTPSGSARGRRLDISA